MKNTQQLMIIYTAPLMRCNVIIEILRDNDINVMAHDRYNAGLQAGFIDGVTGDIELLIEAESEEKAKKLIAEYEATLE